MARAEIDLLERVIAGESRRGRAAVLEVSTIEIRVVVLVEWGLFVVRPHAQHLHHALVGQNLIDEPMLDIDPARHGAIEVAHQPFEGRWSLEGIAREEFEQNFDLRPQG